LGCISISSAFKALPRAHGLSSAEAQGASYRCRRIDRNPDTAPPGDRKALINTASNTTRPFATIIEPVGGEEIPPIVGLIKSPVVAQALGAQHQNAIIAQLMVFDDRQGFKGFAETHAVGDDAASEAVELVNRADDAVPQEPEELLPDGISYACCRLDDALLVKLLAAITKQVEKDQRIDPQRPRMRREVFQLVDRPIARVNREACP